MHLDEVGHFHVFDDLAGLRASILFARVAAAEQLDLQGVDLHPRQGDLVGTPILVVLLLLRTAIPEDAKALARGLRTFQPLIDVIVFVRPPALIGANDVPVADVSRTYSPFCDGFIAKLCIQ